MLDEIYGTYNSTTGSLFTGFVLRSEIEKERVLNDLLDLFIAADKVGDISPWVQAQARS
jgi:histone acetyltransferase HTATIP